MDGGSASWLLTFFLLFSKVCAESYTALGTRVPRVIHLALGTGLFVGPAVPSALCREFPLGTDCAESKGSCAESISLSAEVANPVVVVFIMYSAYTSGINSPIYFTKYKPEVPKLVMKCKLWFLNFENAFQV
jgi:hypothetical protein